MQIARRAGRHGTSRGRIGRKSGCGRRGDVSGVRRNECSVADWREGADHGCCCVPQVTASDPDDVPSSTIEAVAKCLADSDLVEIGGDGYTIRRKNVRLRLARVTLVRS